MIRPATPTDLPNMVPVARKFITEAGLPMQIDEQHWIVNWTSFLASGVGIVLLSEQAGQITGGIGGLQHPDINDGQLMLSEMFWYVDPAHRGDGIRLLQAFEAYARDHGVKRLTMIHLESINNRLGQLYERRGYYKLETHYMKTLDGRLKDFKAGRQPQAGPAIPLP